MKETVEPGKTLNGVGDGDAGFTLVEVIISSMIFLIVSMGFSAGMLAALKTNSMASQHYKATCMARNYVQHARTLAFETIPQMQKTNEWVDEDGNVVGIWTNGCFKRDTLVSFPAGMTNTVEVWVQVYFPRPWGKLSTAPVEVRTYISRAR